MEEIYINIYMVWSLNEWKNEKKNTYSIIILLKQYLREIESTK